MPSGIGSWRRHETSARFVGGRPREGQGAFRVAGRVDDFRLATILGLWDILEASVSTLVVGPAGGDDFVVSRSV